MGRAWLLGDGVSTDAIMPGRYNLTTDPAALARACLCEARPDFTAGVRRGDVIVAGRNFGCGSSREHAPLAIRETGVAAVVAVSLARIFARNAVNIGLPVITCATAVAAIADGDEIAVDVRAGTVTVNGAVHHGDRPSQLALRIAAAGGLVELIRSEGWAALEPAPGAATVVRG